MSLGSDTLSWGNRRTELAHELKDNNMLPRWQRGRCNTAGDLVRWLLNIFPAFVRRCAALLQTAAAAVEGEWSWRVVFGVSGHLPRVMKPLPLTQAGEAGALKGSATTRWRLESRDPAPALPGPCSASGPAAPRSTVPAGTAGRGGSRRGSHPDAKR